jgi:hypothetical protein
MAEYLRRIDAYRRPVSTNTASDARGWGGGYRAGKYDDRFFLLHAPMDYPNHHVYSPDSEAVAKIAERFLEPFPGRPLLLGEWGLDPFSKAEAATTVPVGLHNAIWMGVMTCGAAPHHWYWNKYYEIGGLKHYQILAECLDARNLPRGPLALKTLDAAGPVPLQARGLLASRSLLAWVWDPRSQHGRPVPEPVQGARVRIRGLPEGSYRVQFVDPWSGGLLGGQTLQTATDDTPLGLPVFTRDVALRVLPRR